MKRRSIKFGIIGLGLMGREFATAAARWCALTDLAARPEIVGVCDSSETAFEWFRDNFPSIVQFTSNYHDLLANPAIEAIYCAVPHHFHRQIYCDVIASGKHLLGEKPFGVDLAAGEAIAQAAIERPAQLIRCASEFPFFPAVQKMARLFETGAFGKIVEVNAGFHHSSDLNLNKPINWKRQSAANGDYGCLGDLGLHVCHFPFRAGWQIKDVRAILSNLVPFRPDGKGGQVPCDTWDNGTLFCRTAEADGAEFPMTLKMQRIAPGEKDSWKLEIIGMKESARFSTRKPNILERCITAADGKADWIDEEVGFTPTFPTITGPIFEFGFGDAILQMWAGFIDELANGKPRSRFTGCITPDEALLSHRLFTAAQTSHREHRTVAITE